MDYQFEGTKQPEKVVFTEKGHSYTKGDVPYISVTTLLDRYTKPFDSEYWSIYKSVKDEMEAIGLWIKYKASAGGWQGVVNHYKSMPPHHRKDSIERRRKAYLNSWKKQSDDAASIGSKIHSDLEGDMLNSRHISIGDMGIAEVSSSDILDMQDFNLPNHIFTELLLWNDGYKLAGQADIVQKSGNGVHIKDYKTSKFIYKDPFMGAKFLEPLQELDDTNYNKFTMQLSTYGWMLEQQGYDITGLTLIHLDRITSKYIRDYKVTYRPDLVKKMLDHYLLT